MSKRTLIGIVSSAKMTKTVVVTVESFKMHPKYHKRYRVSKRYPSHTDEVVQVGDRVTIEETRPRSKTVHWKVIRKVKL